MDVRCERCKTEYELNDAQVTEAGVPVKCTSCGYVFRVMKKALAVTVPLKPDDGAQAAPLSAPDTRESREPARGRTWRIRQAEGSVVLLKELTTLQRWIVEKKVGRDDQISLTGETWKKLGEIPELGPFFQVVEDAALGHQLLRKQALAESALPPTGPSSVPLDPANPFPRAVSGEHPSIPAFAQTFSSPPLVTPGEFAAPQIPARPPREPGAEPSRAVRSAARSDADFPADLPLDFNRSRRRGSRFIILLLLLVVAGVAVYGLGLWKQVPLLRAWAEGGAPLAAPELVSMLDAGIAAALDAGSVPDAGSSVGAGENRPGPVDAGTAAPVLARLDASVTSVAAPIPPSQTARLAAEVASLGVQTDAGASLPAPTSAADDSEPTPASDGLPDVAPAVPLTGSASDAGAAARPAPPHDFDYWMARGDRLRQRDHAPAAMDAYGRAVDLSPERAEGYAGRGLALLDMGTHPLAEASFQQALKLNPRYSVALMGLAETYRVMGKKPEAIRYYQKFLDVVPSGTEASAAKAAIQKLREPHE